MAIISTFADYCSGCYGFSISRHTASELAIIWVFIIIAFFPRNFHCVDRSFGTSKNHVDMKGGGVIQMFKLQGADIGSLQ